jgi:hypothetical protein
LNEIKQHGIVLNETSYAATVAAFNIGDENDLLDDAFPETQNAFDDDDSN